MSRVVVVGGGLGGVATAARLADQRHDVTVLEAQPRTGGRLAPVNAGSASFPAAPWGFTLPAVFRDAFRATGRPLEKVLDLQSVDPAVRYLLDDGTTLELPTASRGASLAAVGEALGPAARTAWSAALDHGEDVWQALRERVFEAPHVTTLSRVRTSRPQPQHEALCGAADYSALLTGIDPRRAPSAPSLLTYLEHTFGVWTVAGGTHRLAEQLELRAHERGARVRTGSPVTAIDADHGRVNGVTLGTGETIAADIVVCAVDPVHVPHLTSAPKRRERRARRRVPGAARLQLFLELPETAAVPHTRTVALPRDPQAAVASLFDRELDGEFDGEFDREPGHPPNTDTWIEVSPLDSSSPAGVRIQALVPPHADPDGEPRARRHATVDWNAPENTAQLPARILASLAERGLDLRHPAAQVHVRTPADEDRLFGTPGGSLGGDSTYARRVRPGTSWPHRPGVTTPIRGLYLVGDGAHPGGSVPFVGMAARTVAELIGHA